MLKSAAFTPLQLLAADDLRRPVNRYSPEPTILEYSWTTVDTKYLHDNITEMEKPPFDGRCVFVANPRLPHGSVLSGAGRGDLGWEVFQNVDRDESVIQGAIEDLQTTPFNKLRSNYVVMTSYLPDQQTINWFDDPWWARISNNAKLIATVAQEGGTEGIMFDPEEYGCRFWGFPQLSGDPLYEGKNYEKTAVKTRQRGREFMRAINTAYPGVRILLLHAWETVIRSSEGDPEKVPSLGYGLLPAFLDGMLEASDDDTLLIDGIEYGYYQEKQEDFIRMATSVREQGPAYSAIPEQFRKKVRTGFGIWMDRDRHWDPVHIENNFWTPDRFANTVQYALEASDGFVWIWNERPTWLLDSPDAKLNGGIDFGDPGRNETIKWLPRAYWTALEQARQNARQNILGASPAE